MPKTTVTFGEIMLRLAPPGFERFLQTPQFVATFGGGEANVAVALASFGLPAAYVTVLPDKNPIADAAIGELRRAGVDTSRIVRGKGRVGIYYLEAGANQRASKVVYDRGQSAIALAKPGDIDWDRVFQDAGWFHITGITPAISGSAADLALESVRQAREKGLTVSCDLNYRKNLWKWGKPAVEVMRELVKYVDVAIANEEDVQMTLGIQAEVDVHSGSLDRAQYREADGQGAGGVPQPEGHCHHAAGIQERLAQRLVGVPERPPGIPDEPPLRHHPHCGPRGRRRQLRRRPDLRFPGTGDAPGGARVRGGGELPEALRSRRLQPPHRGRGERAAQERRLGKSAAVERGSQHSVPKSFSNASTSASPQLLLVGFIRPAKKRSTGGSS